MTASLGGRKKPVLVAPRGGLLPSQEQEGMGFCIRDDRWGRSYGGRGRAVREPAVPEGRGGIA